MLKSTTNNKTYDFGEKTSETRNGKDYPVFQTPKYKEAKSKAIEAIESGNFGLEASDFWILQNMTKTGKIAYTGLILSHNGCLKINDALPAEKRFKPECLSLDKEGYNKSLVYSYCSPEQGIFEVGEVSAANCTNGYPYAMSLKRCIDRVILKNSRLAYAGIYSDSEAEEFKNDPEERAKKETKNAKKAESAPEIIEDYNPRKDLVDYCNKVGLKITDVAASYKLNNSSKDEEFIQALEDLKAHEEEL